MHYLVLASVCMAVYAGIYKVSMNRGCDQMSLVFVFYIIAAAAMVVGLTVAGPAFPAEAKQALALGAASGASSYLAIVLFFHAMKRGGLLGISWGVIGLAMVVPVAWSILFWGEPLRPARLAGLACACAAILLMGYRRRA